MALKVALAVATVLCLSIAAISAQQIFPMIVEGQVGETVSIGCVSLNLNEQSNNALEILTPGSTGFMGTDNLPRVNSANDPVNRSLTTFSFGPLTSEDNGVVFRCFSGEFTGNATVNVIFAPVISSVEVNPINEGMSLTIPLTIMANPSPSLVWTLNGQPVDTERGITLSLTSIMFMSVSKQDAGIYIINATNSVGSVTVNFTLDVQYQSQFMSPFVVPNLRCVTVGQPIRCAANPMQSITFLCGASGNPMPTVNVAFTSSTPPVVSGTNISIPSVMSENAGIYTCTAQNQGFADVMRTIQLFVGGPPQAINGVEVQIRSGEIAFSWTYDDSANGVPATAFVITIVRAGNTVLTRTIPVTQRSYTIDVNDLDSSEEHTVTLMVQNLQGNSQTVSNIFTTPEDSGSIGNVASVVVFSLMCAITLLFI